MYSSSAVNEVALSKPEPHLTILSKIHSNHITEGKAFHLMNDYNDEIHLNLPVDGRIDELTFIIFPSVNIKCLGV